MDETPVGEFEIQDIRSCLRQSSGSCVIAPEGRILIIDDCEVNLFVMASLLKQNKVQTTLVQTGAEGMEYLRKESYDIVFFNDNMSNMKEGELWEKIQEEHLRYRARFIALTVYSREADRRRTGYDDCLLKPIRPNSLEQMLQKHLPKEIQRETGGE